MDLSSDEQFDWSVLKAKLSALPVNSRGKVGMCVMPYMNRFFCRFNINLETPYGYKVFNVKLNRNTVVLMKMFSMVEMLKNKRITYVHKGRQHTKNLFDFWDNHRKRSDYDDLIYSPRPSSKKYLNLYTGPLWSYSECEAAYETAEGQLAVETYLKHIERVTEDELTREYVLDWFASIVQKPWHPIESTMYLVGNSEIEKMILMAPLMKLFEYDSAVIKNTVSVELSAQRVLVYVHEAAVNLNPSTKVINTRTKKMIIENTQTHHVVSVSTVTNLKVKGKGNYFVVNCKRIDEDKYKREEYLKHCKSVFSYNYSEYCGKSVILMGNFQETFISKVLSM